MGSTLIHKIELIINCRHDSINKENYSDLSKENVHLGFSFERRKALAEC